MSMDSGQVVSVSISPETIREIAAGIIDRPLSDNEVATIAEAVYADVQTAADSIYVEAINYALGED
jgi:hypothetical protein